MPEMAAGWHITHLLSMEDGPFVFFSIKRKQDQVSSEA